MIVRVTKEYGLGAGSKDTTFVVCALGYLNLGPPVGGVSCPQPFLAQSAWVVA